MILGVFAAGKEEVPRDFDSHAQLAVCAFGCKLIRRQCGTAIVTCAGGPGVLEAFAATTHLVRHHGASTVLAVGFSGRLCPAVSADRIFAVTRVRFCQDWSAYRSCNAPEGAVFEAPLTLVALARQVALQLEIPLSQASGVTTLSFIRDAATAARIAFASQADLVDMESAAVARACVRSQAHWLAIRQISDSADSAASSAYREHLGQGLSPEIGRLIVGLSDRINGPASLDFHGER